MIELIVFLGNPGNEYNTARHNVGWLVAEHNALTGWRKKYKGRYTTVNTVHFLMPETYMNASGESVAMLTSFFHISAAHILVVHDELDLPLGTVALKYSGGLNGHNGLRSLKTHLKTADFWRLRIGIGRPIQGTVHNWVLSSFTDEEKNVLVPVLTASTLLISQILEQEPEFLMPEWQKKVLVPQPLNA
ncbi:MAG: aminoacyl-tRNA hydrolase [Treponema sp.]|jgi:PTH1 family peptidyl-tRNA hydrolase|nr:aminoacyl-tRNA hydrolase [Treponema sp.]